MKYMLDTNTCIAIIKKAPRQLRERLKKISIDDVWVSSIVIAELWFGIEQSQKRKDNETALRDFLKYVTVVDWPDQAAPHYGKIRTYLKRKGTPIGAMELLIAAHALSMKAVLVTHNVREFERVPQLKVEDWVNP
jgi:tRNA(fMet)-specific endonuclease VapC